MVVNHDRRPKYGGHSMVRLMDFDLMKILCHHIRLLKGLKPPHLVFYQLKAYKYAC